MKITRKIVTSEQVIQMRAAAELCAKPDAWMAALILILDPFQRAADSQEFFSVAVNVCYPLESERAMHV